MEEIRIVRTEKSSVELSEICSSAPVFASDEWLSLVLAGKSRKNADRLLRLGYYRNGRIAAYMPLTFRRFWKWKVILMPCLTPYLGIFFHSDAGNDDKFCRRVFEAYLTWTNSRGFIFGLYSFNPDSRLCFITPLLQKIHVETRYTYRLNRNSALLPAPDIRSDIRFAGKNIKTSLSDDYERFLKIWEITLGRQGVSTVDTPVMRSLISLFLKNGKGKLYVSESSGTMQSGCFTISDTEWTYYLAGADLRKIRGSGSSTLTMACTEALSSGTGFDFEGSMIPGIESYFRKFNGQPVPYFSLMDRSTALAWNLKKLVNPS